MDEPTAASRQHETDLTAAQRVVLYPHGGGRELSTKMCDEWKRELGREYVAVDALLSDTGIAAAAKVLEGRTPSMLMRWDGLTESALRAAIEAAS